MLTNNFDSQHPTIKKLKKSSDLVSTTVTAAGCVSEYTANSLANTYNVQNSSSKIAVAPQPSSSIITTSSWRMGEAIAQKHLKQQSSAAYTTDPSTSSAVYTHVTHRSSSAPTSNITQPKLISSTPSSSQQQQQQQSMRKQKKTSSIQDYHLIAPPPPSSSSKVTNTNVKINSPQSASRLGGSKPTSSATSLSSKPHDLSDLHQYMKNQKLKRLYEINSEKEKLKIQEEERKKKLSELYQKQRQQAAATAAGRKNHFFLLVKISYVRVPKVDILIETFLSKIDQYLNRCYLFSEHQRFDHIDLIVHSYCFYLKFAAFRCT